MACAHCFFIAYQPLLINGENKSKKKVTTKIILRFFQLKVYRALLYCRGAQCQFFSPIINLQFCIQNKEYIYKKFANFCQTKTEIKNINRKLCGLSVVLKV